MKGLWFKCDDCNHRFMFAKHLECKRCGSGNLKRVDVVTDERA